MWTEIGFGLLAVAVVYLVALYIAVKNTVDKMGARSALFGAGLVNIVMGSLLYAAIGEIGFAEGYDYWYDGPSMCYYVARFAFLVMALSGVVMVAVDLLKTIRNLQSSVVDVKEKQAGKNEDAKVQPSPKLQSAAKGDIPTWKRIEMEQDAQGKEQ